MSSDGLDQGISCMGGMHLSKISTPTDCTHCTDCTDKKFVGINTTHDEDYNFYMDQACTITVIVQEANLRAKDKKLPYPQANATLSRLESATEEQKKECSKYPYRRVVGQLMYGMVHNMIGIMYAL